MKLSEAIRLGSMLGPQADGYFYLNGATCVQGAALLAMGVPVQHQDNVANLADMERLWPWVLRRETCPVCGERATVKRLIARLNNGSQWGERRHGWTRERIAAWVESLEAAQAIEQPASCDAVREDVGAPVVCPRV